MEIFLKRYNFEQQRIIELYFNKFAKVTTKGNCISDGKKTKLFMLLANYDTDIVIDSLKAYLSKEIAPARNGNGMGLRYTKGILDNKQRDKNFREQRKGANNGTSDGNVKNSQSGAGLSSGLPEGREIEHRELECDF